MLIDTSDHTTYTLSNILIKPSTQNDTEPDSTKAQALTMPLNGTINGHVGYLYNNHRDSVDWYKVTTNADGYLRLTINNEITAQHYNNANFSHNGGIDVAILDHDGTTTLKAYSSDFGYPIVFGVDGLAPGTYYVTVRPRGAYQLNGADGGGYYYSPVNFTPYIISDSLFKPSFTNDAEPDSNKATALILSLNGSMKGHIGYYYNHYNDTADFYKVITDKDGRLNITVTPQQTQGNNQSNNLALQCWLYDKDGKTQLNYSNAGANNAVTISRDGLAAGTYYVRIQPNNNYTDLACCGGGFDTRLAFGPYIISNTLDTYSYINDKEPDSLASQAQTIPANRSLTGHINFTGNGNHDVADWFKINYTGVNGGSMKITYQLQHHLDNEYGNAIFQVFRDTTVGLTYNELSGTDQQTVTINNAQQGYYYLKVTPGNTDRFCIYSIADSFKQKLFAAISVTGYDSSFSCDSVNSITYKCSKSEAPYKVQLYRFGLEYGNVISVHGHSPFTFNGLSDGIYYASAYADGATGNAFGTSDTINIMPTPANPHANSIQTQQAKLNWTIVSCADYYIIQYKKHAATNWSYVSTTGNVNNYVLKGLTASTSYDWHVAAVDSGNNMQAMSTYTDNAAFKTKSGSDFAESQLNEDDNLSIENNKLLNRSLVISPNPATSYFVIHYNNTKQEKANAILYDVNGKATWVSGLINADALNGKQVNVDRFESGLYYLKIINDKGEIIGTVKVSITK